MKRGILLLLCIVVCVPVFAQQSYRVVFYNTENFFDTRNDALTQDDDFTPWGKQHWTEAKYKDKLLKTGRVLKAIGGEGYPAFIGLCEIENRRVIEDLVTKTVLSEGKYGYVHRESPDRRGIDVAFLFRRDVFRVSATDFIPVVSERDTSLRTRDILYVKGVLAERDTLHFFVCHFPSMSGGEVQSEWKRELAASLLKRRIDSLQSLNSRAMVWVMGDLNGKADRPAQQKVLGSRSSESKKIEPFVLYNTGYYLLKGNRGSYKYKGNWQTIDHIMVTGTLLDRKGRCVAGKRLQVFAPSFLLEEDKAYFGFKPFRTYLGPRYNGGYSDHLPVYLDFQVNDGPES